MQFLQSNENSIKRVITAFQQDRWSKIRKSFVYKHRNDVTYRNNRLLSGVYVWDSFYWKQLWNRSSLYVFRIIYFPTFIVFLRYQAEFIWETVYTIIDDPSLLYYSQDVLCWTVSLRPVILDVMISLRKDKGKCTIYKLKSLQHNIITSCLWVPWHTYSFHNLVSTELRKMVSSNMNINNNKPI